MTPKRPPRLDAALAFLEDKDLLLQRFVLSEVLGPPRRLRPTSPRPETKR